MPRSVLAQARAVAGRILSGRSEKPCDELPGSPAGPLEGAPGEEPGWAPEPRAEGAPGAEQGLLIGRTEHLAALTRVLSALGRCRTEREAAECAVALGRRELGAAAAVLWSGGDPYADHPTATAGIGADAARDLLATIRERGAPAVPPRPVSYDLREGRFLVSAVVADGPPLGLLGFLRPDGAEAFHRALAGAIGSSLGPALLRTRAFDEAVARTGRDPLTGLLNRSAIQDALTAEVARAQRVGSHVSFVLIDLYNFTLFNDLYGHEVGDSVLQRVGGLLRECLRAGDVAARYGADEFLVALPHTDQHGAAAFASRVRSSMSALFHPSGDGNRVPVDATVGVATYPDDGRRPDELLAAVEARVRPASADFLLAGGVGGSCGAEGDEAMRSSAVLVSLLAAVESKDRYTRHHSGHVTRYAIGLAGALGLSADVQRTLRVAGLLHDIGKLAVPEQILRKPGALTPGERAIIERHVQYSEEIIGELPNLPAVLGAVGSHHERFDGGGYPRRLAGDDIPYLGRILAVADAYSAMTADRPYRKALSVPEARQELLRVSGRQLDPRMVDVFLEWLLEQPAESAAPSGGAWPLAAVTA